MEISLKSMVLGMVGTNCYFVINEETKEVVIIDPADEAQKIIQKVEELALKPVAILITHGHFDHIMAADALKEQWNIPVCVSLADQMMMADPGLNGCFMIGKNVCVKANQVISDKESLVFGGMMFEVIATPGHTSGGVCYYMPQVQILFSGDTLFCGSVGRTDLPTGSMGTLVRSIKERLMVLDDNITVLPGHGGATTIGDERRMNPFF